MRKSLFHVESLVIYEICVIHKRLERFILSVTACCHCILRLDGVQEVAGSNPVAPTLQGLSQLGVAMALFHAPQVENCSIGQYEGSKMLGADGNSIIGRLESGGSPMSSSGNKTLAR
jgi:hypothetical protein